MDPIVTPLAIAAGTFAAQGIAGFLGRKAQAKSQGEQMKIQREMMDYIKNIPNPQELPLVYKQLQDAGEMTPELEKEILVKDTELKNIVIDPRLKEAQMGALTQLQDLAKSGGLDAMDRSNLEQARRRAVMESANQQSAVQENMARRGMGGSGAELVQRQMAAQAAANQANSADLQIQGEARRRALEAMMKSGQLGGDIRGQEYSEQSDAAKAQDLINQFNVKNRIGTQSNNVNALNEAKMFNLGTKQKDIIMGNEATKYNLGAGARRFDRDIAKSNALQGGSNQMSSLYGEQAKSDAEMYKMLIEGLGKTGATAAATDWSKIK